MNRNSKLTFKKQPVTGAAKPLFRWSILIGAMALLANLHRSRKKLSCRKACGGQVDRCGK